MHLTRLSLTNFRNYARQDLDLSEGTVLLFGENAQGKTNILEAAFLLAAGRSERASVDADYIAWDSRGDAQPFARIAAKVTRTAGDATVELTFAGREGAAGRLVASKRFKLNGVAKRGSDVTGVITCVLFTTDDMDLVRGAPSGRRRFMDTMLVQADRPYARALQHYNKVLPQRNALLKRIKEGAADRDELSYWDEELAREGAILVAARARAIEELKAIASELHAELSGGQEAFAIEYAPRLSERDATGEGLSHADETASRLLQALGAGRTRDIAAGLTLMGPHRDDIEMTLDEHPAASFASRGQQRTAALALRLAEARLLLSRTGERPVLLLDDVLSELDASRRAGVLGAVESDQVIVTSADADRFDAAVTRTAQVWRIEAGKASRNA